jgi:23S rRNA (uracil-5-)-methyltransferase RumA
MNACNYVGKCGGCTYFDIPYPEELALKEKALRETLGEYAYLLEGIRPALHINGYRNKMELAFGDSGRDSDSPKNEAAPYPLALGIRKKRSFYEVATIENCILVPDDFKLIAAYALQFFRESGEAVFHRKTHKGALRHLVLRRGHFTGEILVLLSTTSQLKTALQPFVQGLRSLPTRGAITGVLHAVNDGVADAVKNENVQILWGRDFYREKLCGLTFQVSAFSFFQTNSADAEKLYEIIRELANGGGLAYDLYCGTGTIAQIIAPLFNKVIGMELIPEAIAAAQTNARLNHITNCEFLTHDITNVHFSADKSPPACIIVDPPRDGLSPKALAKIAALSPERFIYVACKPASLARDLPLLIQSGLTPACIIGADLFPRTPHVEAIALLCRTDT